MGRRTSREPREPGDLFKEGVHNLRNGPLSKESHMLQGDPDVTAGSAGGVGIFLWHGATWPTWPRRGVECDDDAGEAAWQGCQPGL